MMDVFNFVDYLDFNECNLQNLGYEFFDSQLVLTITTKQFGNTKENQFDNGILLNLLFEGIQDIVFSSQNYTISSNKILNVTSIRHNEAMSEIKCVFLSENQEIALSFKASRFEGEFLNPCLDFNQLFIN